MSGPAEVLLGTARAELEAYHAHARDEQRALAEGFLAALSENGSAALRKDGGPEHLTASFVVFSDDGDRVLLHLHRKAAAWGHFGGHLESDDASLRDAAERECAEESGLPIAALPLGIAELHQHDLDGGFHSCRSHLDVVFLGVANPQDALHLSDESLQLGWFGLDELPEGIMPDLPARLPALSGLLTSAVQRR